MTSATNWCVNVSSDDPAIANYVFSQGNCTTNASNVAYLASFTAKRATNHITGFVKDTANSPLSGISANGNANIGGTNYQAGAQSDSTGFFSMAVANGTWMLNLDCDSNKGVTSSGYCCPNNQTVTISGADAATNFTVIAQTGVAITAPSQLPDAGVGVFYSFQFTNLGCLSPFTWTSCSPPPPSLSLDPSGNLSGIPAAAGSNYFCVQVMDSASHTATSNFTLIVRRLQITTPSLFNGAVAAGYTNQFVADYGQPPYTWSFNSGSLPASVNFSSAGVLTGIPSASGTFNFNVGVTDANLAGTNRSYSLLINPRPSAPPFRWAVKAGGSADDQAYGLAVDSAGNAYITGHFYSTNATFGAFTLTNKGSADTFIAKYNNAGNVLWARSAGGAGNDQGTRLALDTNGNCYVTGLFGSPTITFGSFTLTNVATDGSWDLLLVKYDSNGNVVWAKSAGGPGFDAGNSVAVDTTGNVFVTGYFDGTNVNVGGTILTNNGPAGTSDLFLAKYNSAGALQWVRSAGGNSDDFAFVGVDAATNSYITGFFVSPTISFGGVTLTNTSLDGSEDMFVAKYNSAGNLLWARRAVGDSANDGRGIAVDAAGNCYIAGHFFSDSITFGNVTLMNAGGADIFVVKYDPAGNVLWAKRAGGSKSDQGIKPVLDSAGNLYVAGHFKSSNAGFDATTLASGGNFDVFLALIDGVGPPLNIQLAGAQALLTWPTNRPGYQLESESALASPGAWSAVTNPVAIVGNQYTVTNNLSDATKSYRLRSQ